MYVCMYVCMCAYACVRVCNVCVCINPTKTKLQSSELRFEKNKYECTMDPERVCNWLLQLLRAPVKEKKRRRRRPIIILETGDLHKKEQLGVLVRV